MAQPGLAGPYDSYIGSQHHDEFNLYGMYRPAFAWQALELAAATSIGIIFAISWGDTIAEQDRDITAIERAFVAFAITFVVALIMKSIIDFFAMYKHLFDIY